MKITKSIIFACLIIVFQMSVLSESYNNDVIIKNPTNTPVTIYKSISQKKDAFGVNYLSEIRKLDNIIYAKCLYSANYGFEGDPVGYQIETKDNIKGWVSLENVWFPGKVQNVKNNDVLNIRIKESESSDITDKLINGDTLYINASYIINTMGHRGAEPTDWVPVFTKNQKIGYAKMSYINIVFPNISKFNKL
ncbi:hypothetical protein AB3N59_01310 [Leptospira sp. WS92.C1]